MNDNGHPLWLVLGAIAFFPIAAAVEIVWAIFSRRVRGYIAKHPIAHFMFFACALFMILLLIPAPSKPRRKQGETNNVAPNLRSALDYRTVRFGKLVRLRVSVASDVGL
jgi:hypothetical protein